MPDISVVDAPFQEAIDFMRGKLKITTSSWDEMRGPIHARAFTVAGANKAALVDDMFTAVLAAQEKGETITDFRKQFDSIVSEHGWSYKGKRGWRTRIIYDTNLRTAHAAGRWAQIQRTKDSRPFLQYLTVGDSRVRPEHRSWHGIILNIEDAWWNTHYPPNGWGCRCIARTLSKTQLEREGLKVTNQAPSLNRTTRINTNTGEILGKVPMGIDPGWDYNVGKAWLGPDSHLGELVVRLAPPLRTQALKQLAGTSVLDKPFNKWGKKVLESAPKFQGAQQAVGYIEPELFDRLVSDGQEMNSALIVITDRDFLHLTRPAKRRRNQAIQESDTLSLPKHLRTRRAVLRDMRDGALVYVFDPEPASKKAKIIVRLNYRRRGDLGNHIKSAGLVEVRILKDPAFFEVLVGSL